MLALFYGREIGTELVGSVLPGDTFEVRRNHTVEYALAVGDDNKKYVGGHSLSVIAPPMFGICFANRVILRAIDKKILSIPLSRTVHGEHEMFFASCIRPGDFLISEGIVTNVEQHSTGSTVTIEVTSKTQDGILRVRQIQTLFVRAPTSVRTHHRRPTPPIHPEYTATVKVPKEQVFRYARASFTEGAQQHEDHAYARSLGYNTYFLTGQHTLAFAAKSIVDHAAKGDPELLQRLKVRFSQVAYPLDFLTTNVYRGSSIVNYVFDTIKQDGSAVLTNGEADIYSA